MIKVDSLTRSLEDHNTFMDEKFGSSIDLHAMDRMFLRLYTYGGGYTKQPLKTRILK
jgi:hypothetical protein